MKPNKIPDRNVLYPCDIHNILGKSIRTCRRIGRMICEAFGKPYLGFVTIPDFCAFYKMREEDVRKYILC